MYSHAKVIRGLSIACVVLTALTVMGCLIGILASGLVAGSLNAYQGNLGSGPYGGGIDLHDLLDSHGYDHIPGYYDDVFDYDYDYVNTASNAGIAIAGLSMIFLIPVVIMQACAFAAALIALLNANKPQKLGLVFGWSIAGAVLSFLSGGLPQLALFIIIAVFVSKDRKLADGSVYYTQPPTGAQ